VKKGWFTTRKILTVVGFITATGLVCLGKISDTCWVYALAVLLAGHHAADIVKASRGEDK
jgi:hypothetical protein